MNSLSVLLAAAAPASGGPMAIIPLLLMYAAIFGVFWFFFLRPQKKQQKAHAAMLTTLEAGDSILTTSGFYGVAIDIMDEVVIVEFGNNKNCRIPMKKDAITEIEKAGQE